MGEATQVALAKEFQVTAASMSTMTARLIANGYVKRRGSHADKRANVLELTDAGRSFLEEVHKAWAEIDDYIEHVLGKQEARNHSKEALKLVQSLSDNPPAE